MSETSAETLVTQDMIDRKGVWGGERTSPPISESDIRKWAIATYWPQKPPQIYWDTEYASGTKWGSIIAPPDFNPFAWPVERGFGAMGGRPRQGGGAGGRPAGGAAAGGRRLTGMNGGQTDTYGVPMRPGDVIRSRSRLQRWEEREGRLGLTLYTYTENEWRNQDDDLVRTRISVGIRY